MSSTLTALTEATTFATTDLAYGSVSGNSRKFTYATLGKLFGTGTLPFAAGTITTSQPSTFTQTWNAAGVAFTGQKIEITNTASAAESRAFEVVMASANNKYAIATGTAAGGTPLCYFRADGVVAGQYILTANNSTAAMYQTTVSGTVGFVVKDTGSYGFSADGNWFGTQDVQLWRDDAISTLALRTGTAAQTFRIYRTFTDTSNYERLALQSASGRFDITAETAGTGTDNINIRLSPVGTGYVESLTGFRALSGVSVNGGLGFGPSAGSATTQATSKTTTVAPNTLCGQITMNNAALTAGASAKFVVGCVSIQTSDTVIVNHASAGTAGAYRVDVCNIQNLTGFDIQVTNISGGSLSEAIVLNFTIIKGNNGS